MKYKNGDIYEGGWKSNLKEGVGKFRSRNGDEYDGEYF